MKKMFVIGLSVCALTSYADTTSKNAIYGKDNRKEIYETSEAIQNISKSTAGMIENYKLLEAGDSHKMLPPKKLGANMPLCPGEKFVNQSQAVTCSGFLVGPDLLVTAGHCVNTEEDCSKVSFVFDYTLDKMTHKEETIVKNENIYKCAKVIDARLEMDSKNPKIKYDYSLIKLDRVVKGRTPLKFRTEGKIDSSEELYVIGHPIGLPTKFADGAKVVKNEEAQYFATNLDTFGGNSGSAVFNAKTNEVEGILVRGEKDFIVFANMCYMSNRLEEDAVEKGEVKNGEEVSRITSIPTLMHRKMYHMAIELGNISLVKEILSYIKDPNIHDDNLNTAVMLAIKHEQPEILELILSKISEEEALSGKNLKGKTVSKLLKKCKNQKVKSLLTKGS